MGNYFGGELLVAIEPKSLKFSDCFNLLKEYLIQSKEEKSSIYFTIIDENGIVYDSYSGIFETNPQNILEKMYQKSLKGYEAISKNSIEQLLYSSEQHEFFQKIKNNEINYENVTVDQVKIRCFSKHFSEYDDELRIFKILEKLKPFKNEKSDNFIGQIDDEEQTYKKSFWWDLDELNNEIESRKCLCGNCEFHEFGKELCPRFEICSRAFNLGQTTQDNKLIKKENN